MAIPNLTFPLRVDFGQSHLWLEDEGPFMIGEVVSDFFGDNTMGVYGQELFTLTRELAAQLVTYGNLTQPFAPGHEPGVPIEVLTNPELSAVSCSVCYAYHMAADGSGVLVERYVFQSLRDFLYVELGKAMAIGNAPRQCRRCKRWFFHQSGEKYVYCNRVSPGEETRTCREIGATANFEDKVANNDVWKFYKRAYKKYYARVMKGRMSRQEFEAWVVISSALRDETNDLWLAAKTQEEKDAIIQRYRGQLNCI